jgi:hypothetical protein
MEVITMSVDKHQATKNYEVCFHGFAASPVEAWIETVSNMLSMFALLVM